MARLHRTWINFDACLRIGREMRGPLRYLALLVSLIPKFIRDSIYRLILRYRGWLFGKLAECHLWDDNWNMRFVDDANFGGRGNDADPFANPNLITALSGGDKDDNDDDWEEATQGELTLRVGDRVRVISSRPILHSHVEGYQAGDGLFRGTIGDGERMLERWSHPKNVAVRFELEGVEGIVEGGGRGNHQAHFL
ncbi:hypothetical protein ACHAXA_001153 [Cyclostephanos tholiformis]|uniref:Uncharacterized protein n=1 Tax=Cyclostephanos tholiformis TaxID=382380 RepID=A0ABD3RCN8_9STRA